MESSSSYISNGFALFYINATRRRFGEVAKNVTDLSRHESLKAARVHETTMCVTFGALHVGTNFRVLTRRSNYAMICMTSGTPVPQTPLYVIFGALQCSSVLGVLGCGRKGRRRNPGPTLANRRRQTIRNRSRFHKTGFRGRRGVVWDWCWRSLAL